MTTSLPFAVNCHNFIHHYVPNDQDYNWEFFIISFFFHDLVLSYLDTVSIFGRKGAERSRFFLSPRFSFFIVSIQAGTLLAASPPDSLQKNEKRRRGERGHKNYSGIDKTQGVVLIEKMEKRLTS